MAQGPSEEPDDQDIPPPRNSNPDVYYLVRKRPSVHPILSQLNSVHTLTSYIVKINLILSPRLCALLPSSFLLSSFQTKILCVFFLSPMCATCPPNLIPLDSTTINI